MMEDINNGKYNFKKKSILVLLIGIFLVLNLSFVSATTFDNLKSFNKDIGNYGKVTIKDWFGLQDLVELEVKENTDVCILNRCRAEIDITIYQKGSLVDDVRFVGGEVNSYQFYLNGNPYNYEEVEPGTYNLELVGDIIQTTDWQITSQGKLLDEWLLWNPDDGLVSYYSLNETTGATAEDTPGPNDGTNQNMENGDWKPGKINNSLEYGGTNEYTNIGTMGNFGSNMSNGFTISMWVNSTDGSSRQGLLGTSVDTGSKTGLHVYWNGQVSSAYEEGTVSIILRDEDSLNLQANVITGLNLSNSSWYHFAAVINGSSNFVEIYINGVNQTLSDWVQQTPDNTADFARDMILGGNNYEAGITGYFIGSLDEVGFWNTTLSASEISSLYNYGEGLSYGGIGSTLLTLTINSPLNDSKVYAQENITINSSSSTLSTLTNTTLFLDGVLNETIIISGTSNETVFDRDISSFNLGPHDFTIELCDLISCINTTTYFELQPFKINNETYNSTTYETSNENFLLNLTSNDSYSITANLIYDGTSYAGTKIGDDSEMTFSRTIDIPSNGTNEFYWTINTGTLFNSTIQNQTAAEINLSFCGGAGGSVPYINFTFKDEETLATINATADLATWNYWLGSGTATKSLLFTNTTDNLAYPFCFNPADKTLHNDLTFQYAYTGYPQRVHFRESDLTNTTTNQVLYLLSSTDGIYSSIQVVSASGAPISGVTVTVERQFSGVWTLIGQDTTDSAGLITFWVNPDYDHKFSFSKTGCTGITQTIRPTQTTYTQTLNCEGDTSDIYISQMAGIRYTRGPRSGILYPGLINFSYTLFAEKSNIANAKFEIKNLTGSTLNSTSSVCAPSGCVLSFTYSATAGENIKGHYYVDIGNGYYLVEGDAYWRLIATNVSDTGTIKEFWLNFRDLFDEWGADEVDLNNKLEYSRIVFIFLMLAIALALFNKSIGNYDGSYPGAFAIAITMVILMGSLAGGLTGQGFFYYSGLFGDSNVAEFMNNYILAMLSVLMTATIIMATVRRNS